jgi:hypothetical protein
VIVKMIVEKQMECRLAGETEVLRRKPAPAPVLFITKSHMTRPGFELGPPRWEAGDYYLLLLLLLFGFLGYWHCGHSWPIVPASGDSEDDCGEADGM